MSWRCDPAHERHYGVGFRAFRTSADDRVVLRPGPVSKHVLPGDAVRFPMSSARLQRLSFMQGTEPRTLFARVTVDFTLPRGYDYCASYNPPRTSVQLWTHRN